MPRSYFGSVAGRPLHGRLPPSSDMTLYDFFLTVLMAAQAQSAQQNDRIPRCNAVAPKGNGSTQGCAANLNVALACTPIPRQVPYAPERPYLKGENPQRSPAWGFYFGNRGASIAAGNQKKPR